MNVNTVQVDATTPEQSFRVKVVLKWFNKERFDKDERYRQQWDTEGLTTDSGPIPYLRSNGKDRL